MEFTFEQSSWEQAVENLHPGDRLGGAECLALLSDFSQEDAENALLDLEEKGITLDIKDLPKLSASGEAAQRLKLEQRLAQSGQLLNSLEENDPLRLYLQELSQMPPAGDKASLAAHYAAGDEAAAGELVNAFLPLVVERACAMTGQGVLLLDLIQEGSLGLWQGVLNYTQGDLNAYILWWIDQYLSKTVLLQAHSSGIWQKMRQGMEDYRDADQELLSQLGRNPTLEEIAEAIHVSAQEAEAFAAMLSQARTKQRIEENRQPKAQTPEDEQAVENTAYFQTRQRILEMLSTLPEQQAKLLTLRFGLESGLPLTPQQTATQLGLSVEEITELEAAALAHLRQQEK